MSETSKSNGAPFPERSLRRQEWHDLNNVLTVVTAYSEVLLTHALLDDSKRRIFRELHAAANRAVQLTRAMSERR
jgi:hypothetical protein